MRACVVVLVTVLAAIPVRAAGERTPDAAVGRANWADTRRTGACTMFAVAPRVAVTAAHCVRNIAPRRLHLLFGYARMGWVRHLTPITVEALRDDVAVLCLGEDAPAFHAPADAPAAGETVRVTGYGIPVSHLQTSAACRVVAADGRTMMLDCPQAPGASGSPVLSATGGAVGVVSQTSTDASFAALLPADIAARCP